MCQGKPAQNVKVKLYDDDRGIDADDLMGETTTNDKGYFENIYHKCADGLKLCDRKFTIKIKDNYVTKGKKPSKLYDVGRMELEGGFSVKMSSSALSGIRILDFSRVVAAPFASMILSDLGAEVWKIERPGNGDDSRLFTPPEINGQSCYTLGLNRNKKSIAMNLAHPEAKNLARKLATKVDIMIENFKTGYMKKFGLDYSQLQQINPGLIYCSITGFGPDGPYADVPGYDVIAAAVGGLLGITGPKGAHGEPVKTGVAVTDLATGLFAHGAILAALLHRNKTGK
uniref:CoA transferase n=1 Tax=Globodera pallida TaxID=36090 RepID=A0A183BS31_GLOPA